MKKENIPNILTIIRFIFIPFIYISVLSKHFLTALIIFTLSKGIFLQESLATEEILLYDVNG